MSEASIDESNMNSYQRIQMQTHGIIRCNYCIMLVEIRAQKSGYTMTVKQFCWWYYFAYSKYVDLNSTWHYTNLFLKNHVFERH